MYNNNKQDQMKQKRQKETSFDNSYEDLDVLLEEKYEYQNYEFFEKEPEKSKIENKDFDFDFTAGQSFFGFDENVTNKQEIFNNYELDITKPEKKETYQNKQENYQQNNTKNNQKQPITISMVFLLIKSLNLILTYGEMISCQKNNQLL